jgi:hypothetical protein
MIKKSEFWNMKRIKKIWNCEKSFVYLYSFIDILDINKQVSYNGYYSSLPSLRLQFDSEYLLNLLSHGVTGNTSDFGSEESRFEPLWDNIRELPEWLKEQIANLSSRKGCIGSNPILSAILEYNSISLYRIVAIAGDCKSPLFGVRRFESFCRHKKKK